MNKLDFLGLLDQTVIITGGMGILGSELCKLFGMHGAKVACLDINSEVEEFAVMLAKETNGCIRGIHCDVSNINSVQAAVSKVRLVFGKISILINNAATKGPEINKFFEPYETYSVDYWNEIMSINVTGMFLMSQAVGRVFLEQASGGNIVQISSVYGIQGVDQRVYEGSEYLGCSINTPAVYSVSKAAIIGLTKYLATYWGHHNIRVNAVVPGGIQSGQNSTFSQKYSETVPLNRMAKVREIANAIIYLSSNASTYVTGHVMVVDGGKSCW